MNGGGPKAWTSRSKCMICFYDSPGSIKPLPFVLSFLCSPSYCSFVLLPLCCMSLCHIWICPVGPHPSSTSGCRMNALSFFIFPRPLALLPLLSYTTSLFLFHPIYFPRPDCLSSFLSPSLSCCLPSLSSAVSRWWTLRKSGGGGGIWFKCLHFWYFVSIPPLSVEKKSCFPNQTLRILRQTDTSLWKHSRTCACMWVCVYTKTRMWVCVYICSVVESQQQCVAYMCVNILCQKMNPPLKMNAFLTPLTPFCQHHSKASVILWSTHCT